MSAAWEQTTGAGVAAHLARLYQEALGRRRLLFVATPGRADLATWGAGAAFESHAVAVIDLCTLDKGRVRLIHDGLPASADLHSAPLKAALRQIELLCIHGIDTALGALRRDALFEWLDWMATNVPLTMLATRRPEMWAASPELAHLPVGVDRVDNQIHSVPARQETVDLINRLLERKR